MAKLASRPSLFRREQPHSEARMRVAVGREAHMSYAVQEVEFAIRQHGTSEDSGVLMGLRLAMRATVELESSLHFLGAEHLCAGWLDVCVEWITGVSATLVSAYSYEDGAQRRVALELAAEESAMRLIMNVAREGEEAVAMLRNLDRHAARAASELTATIDLADRMLHARVM